MASKRKGMKLIVAVGPVPERQAERQLAERQLAERQADPCESRSRRDYMSR